MSLEAALLTYDDRAVASYAVRSADRDDHEVTLAGAPWLIGPLLGTLSLALFYLVTKTMYDDRRIIMLSSCLLLLSPFFLFMSSSYMNHTSTLFFLLLFLYAYLKMFASDSPWWALLAGLSLGYAAAIRPLDAAAFAAPRVAPGSVNDVLPVRFPTSVPRPFSSMRPA